MGWEVGVDGEPKAGSSLHWNRKVAEVQKGAQCTCQAEKVVGSSFTPSVT